jgi:hypothetical protein
VLRWAYAVVFSLCIANDAGIVDVLVCKANVVDACHFRAGSGSVLVASAAHLA